MPSRELAVVASLALAAPLSGGPPTEPVKVRTIAKFFENAPGQGTQYFEFGDPVINNDGTVAFFAVLAAGLTDSIWTVDRDGNYTVVAKQGEALPPAAGTGTWDVLTEPYLAGTGEVAFVGATSETRGIYWGLPDSVEILYDEEVTPPDAPPGASTGFGGFGQFAIRMGLGGDVAAILRLDGGIYNSTPDAGYWVGRPGDFNLAVATRQTLPTPTIPNLFVDRLTLNGINSRGEMMFYAQDDNPNTTYDDAGYYLWDESGYELIVRALDPAPDLDAPSFVSNFDDVTGSLNDARNACFLGVYRDLPAPPNRFPEGEAIWAGRSFDLRVAAFRGMPIKELPGFYLNGIEPQVRFGGRGSVAFPGIIDTDGMSVINDRALFLYTPADGLRMIAREGDHVPGQAPDIVYAAPFDQIALSSTDRLVFLASLKVETTTPIIGNILFASDPQGDVVHVLGTGDQVRLAPNDVRTVGDLELVVGGSAESGVRNPINDRGEVALTITFPPFNRNPALAVVQLPLCPADVTTTGSGPTDPSYGLPDDRTDLSDLLFFVNVWQADLGATPGSIADVTTTGVNEGDPGFGDPDGNVDLTDLLYYVNQWQVGIDECEGTPDD